MNDSLTHVPHGKWQFDEEVAKCFSDMLSRSVPSLGMFRATVRSALLSDRFKGRDLAVLEVGCSNGDMIETLSDLVGDNGSLLGVDVSPAMIERGQERFGSDPRIRLECSDIRETIPGMAEASFDAVSLPLVLQFIPVEDRPTLVSHVYRVLKPGGTLFLFEKTVSLDAVTQAFEVSMYHGFKHENGYSWESIREKAESLKNVMVTLTREDNSRLLGSCPWTLQTEFLRWMNFSAWVCFK